LVAKLELLAGNEPNVGSANQGGDGEDGLHVE
jgi:hypothetical protein